MEVYIFRFKVKGRGRRGEVKVGEEWENGIFFLSGIKHK
jgi:hypothetical protein